MKNKKEKQSQERNDNKRRCDNCGSGYGYLRIKEKQWVCRQCGNVQELDQKGDKK